MPLMLSAFRRHLTIPGSARRKLTGSNRAGDLMVEHRQQRPWDVKICHASKREDAMLAGSITPQATDMCSG